MSHFLDRFNVMRQVSSLEQNIKKIEQIIDGEIRPNNAENFRIATNALRDAKEAIKQIPIAVTQAKEDIGHWTVDIVGKAKGEMEVFFQSKIDAMQGFADRAIEVANAARERALEAVEQAKDLANRFAEVGRQLSTDLNDVVIKGRELLTVMIREFSGISKTFIDLGNDLVSQGLKIGASTLGIFETIKTLTRQMWNKTVYIRDHWLRHLPNSAEPTLENAWRFAAAPWNLTMSVVNTVFIVDLMKPFLPEHTDPVVKNEPLLGIFRSGISLMSDGLRDLGADIKGVGDVFSRGATDISNRIQSALTLVEGSFNDFINAFFTVFNNLQLTLRGEL